MPPCEGEGEGTGVDALDGSGSKGEGRTSEDDDVVVEDDNDMADNDNAAPSLFERAVSGCSDEAVDAASGALSIRIVVGTGEDSVRLGGSSSSICSGEDGSSDERGEE